MALLDLLGRRWTLRSLWELSQGPCSFRDLQMACDKVSSSVLNTRLAELKAAELIELGEQGYQLSALGAELMQELAPLREWSRRWARRVTPAAEG